MALTRNNSNRNRRNFKPRIRCNERIRAPQVRVIGPDGSQLGVMHPKEALQIAKSRGLDLIEVSATAKPPVCRISDFGKYQYEQSKKTKDNKAKTIKNKEIKFRVNIDAHDYQVKIKHAEEFLYKGMKTKMSLSLRGREMQHKDLAFQVMKRIEADLIHVAQVEVPTKMVNRNLSLFMAPLPEGKRKLRYNKSPESFSASQEESPQERIDEDQ